MGWSVGGLSVGGWLGWCSRGSSQACEGFDHLGQLQLLLLELLLMLMAELNQRRDVAGYPGYLHLCTVQAVQG